jgi:hypothetical protein
MGDNIERTLKPVPVTPDSTSSIDYDKLTDEQKLIANKIFDEAERQGVDPDLMLSLAHIENRFNIGPSPKGALGPMQLMPGTAKDLGVDPNNIDQNIAGGVTYFKTMLDKYKDPDIAAIAYNAGPGVADKFLETDDLSVLPPETKNYIEQLDMLYKPKGAEVDVNNVPVIQPLPEEKAAFERDAMAEAAGAGVGAAAGLASGAYTETKIKQAETGEKATQRQVASAEKRIAAGETRVAAKEGEHTGRLKIQTTATESSVKEAARLREAQLAAEKRLAKATDNARRYGVLEEVVKTTPGGVTQQGGLGSGAMRHANVMGEVHEANVVRKGTETAGPGYSQKSRLIVPDKYAGASVYTPEQIAAQKELAAADAEHQRLIKAADKAEGVAQKEADRLRNLTERGPSGKTAAQASLDIAKQDYANAAAKKVPGVGTNIVRYLSKIPGMSMLPGAASGLDLVEAGERFKQGDYPGAAISGVGAVGGALSMIPPIGPVGAGLKVIGGLTSLAAPALNYYRDSREPEQTPGYAAGGKVAAILADKAKKAGTKLDEILKNKQAPMTTPRGTGLPLLPRSGGMYTPGVQQKNLARMPMVDAARATGKQPKYTDRMQDLLDSPTARKKANKLIEKGQELGMTEWYGTEPLRQFALDIGLAPQKYDEFLAQMASASQRNPVDQQNKMGSYLWYLSQTGQLPEDAYLLTNKIKRGKEIAPAGTAIELPPGYGSLAQGDIFTRGKQIASGDIEGALPEERKLGTFYRNLQGNLVPVTVDVNAVRGPIIERGDPRWLTSKLVEKDEEGNVIATHFPRKDFESGKLSLKQAKARPGFWEAAPSGSEYAGFEDFWQRAARRYDLAPAEAQALGWYGSADVTALKTKPELYIDNLERMVRRTAEQTGQNPTTVMEEMLRGNTYLKKKGGLIKGYAKGGNEGADIDAVAEYYGNRLDASNSDMRPPVISDKGNVVHNMVAQRDRLADKYLGGVGRFASRGLEGLRTALDSNPAFDKSVLYPEAANLKVGSDLLIGQLPETLYDYTTSGQPGFVRGNEWVPNTAAGGMMHTDPYGDINAFDFLNLLGIEAPIAAGAKTVYKVAKPLARSATEHAVSGINRANRALRTPEPILMNVETGTANRSDDAAETLRRFKEASGASKDYPVGQGVWTGEEGAAQFHPNVMVNMQDFSPEQIDRMRRMLDQYGIGAGRFRPDLISQPSRANAVQVLGADPEWIKNIGQHYAENDLPAVVFAQPNNRAMVFNMNSDLPKDLSVLLDAPQLKGKKVRYGEANIPTDRNYIDSVESARVTGTKKAPKKKAK